MHCSEGKDRTGIVIAVLEGLTGASLEEIVTDYSETYLMYIGLSGEEIIALREALR